MGNITRNGDGYKLYYANTIEDTEYNMNEYYSTKYITKNSNINKITSDSYIYIEYLLTGNKKIIAM